MKTEVSRSGSRNLIRRLVAIVCAMLIVPADGLISARSVSTPIGPRAQEAASIPSDQLDSLVAPIALYPDPLLSQTLVASTYPLELIQLQQWLEKNKGIKDKKLVDAVSKQSWDPSIQAMAALPDVVKRLADDIQWTTDLGNAFLAQQAGVMDAVQRMRRKAQDIGALQSNQQQKVETQVVESKTVIVVQQADPQVVYVPSYDPLYAFGSPFYPYPPIYYPSYPAGAVAAGAILFGAGLALGAAWGGGWGWGAGWGNNDININRNNNFNRNTNIGNIGNRNNISGSGNRWQHNPQHRGGAPYGDRGTANRFGGSARGDSLANRQAGARQQIGRQGGNLPSTREGGGNRAQNGALGGGSGRGPAGDRAGAGDRSRGSGVGDRAGAGAGDRSLGGSSRSGGGGDRIGSRDVGGGSGGGSRGGAFGGGSQDRSGSSARSSSSRGTSSMGGSRGGGFSGGGGRGGGGGGGRGGGRRR